MRKKSFTLLEIMIVVVVMVVLATMAIPAYQGVVEKAKAKICETNLKALEVSLDIYAMEHDTMPASLSELPQEYIKLAYSRILRQKDAWKIKLAYFISGVEKRGMVYAAFLRDDIAKGDIGLISCPKDHTPPAQGGISYGFNSILAKMSARDYQNLPDATLLIGDCDGATFTNPSDLAETRHKEIKILFPKTYAQSISKAKEIFECAEGKTEKKYEDEDEEDDDEDEKMRPRTETK